MSVEYRDNDFHHQRTREQQQQPPQQYEKLDRKDEEKEEEEKRERDGKDKREFDRFNNEDLSQREISDNLERTSNDSTTNSFIRSDENHEDHHSRSPTQSATVTHPSKTATTAASSSDPHPTVNIKPPHSSPSIPSDLKKNCLPDVSTLKPDRSPSSSPRPPSNSLTSGVANCGVNSAQDADETSPLLSRQNLNDANNE